MSLSGVPRQRAGLCGAGMLVAAFQNGCAAGLYTAAQDVIETENQYQEKIAISGRCCSP
jgi:hypothetical protein